MKWFSHEYIMCMQKKTKPATIGFYRDLHKYQQHWPPTSAVSKSAIGTLYLQIDVVFQTRKMSSQPSNIYSFVQRVVGDFKKSSSEAMHYGTGNTVEELMSTMSGNHSEVEKLTEKSMAQQKEFEKIKKQMDIAKCELAFSRGALTDITNKFKIAVKQRDCARKKGYQLQGELDAVYQDSVYYEEEMLAKVDELNVLVHSLRKEMAVSVPGASKSAGASGSLFCFETKEGGHVYSTSIRQLYYKLLADGLSPARIASMIRSVLKTFYPSLDVDKLKLPSETCASYMRREELTTVNLAHNAMKLAESDCFNLNCDGTTLHQKKLQSAAINGTVLSVNEEAESSFTFII